MFAMPLRDQARLNEQGIAFLRPRPDDQTWWDALDPHARSRFRVGVVAIIILLYTTIINNTLIK